MQTMLAALAGKKTYIMSGLGVAVVGLWMFGVIDDAMANQLLALFGFGGLAALKAGQAKSEAKP